MSLALRKIVALIRAVIMVLTVSITANAFKIYVFVGRI